MFPLVRLLAFGLIATLLLAGCSVFDRSTPNSTETILTTTTSLPGSFNDRWPTSPAVNLDPILLPPVQSSSSGFTGTTELDLDPILNPGLVAGGQTSSRFGTTGG